MGDRCGRGPLGCETGCCGGECKCGRGLRVQEERSGCMREVMGVGGEVLGVAGGMREH